MLMRELGLQFNLPLFRQLKKQYSGGKSLKKDKRRISHVRAHLCTLSTRRSRGRTICLLLFPQTVFVKGVNGHKFGKR